jgi:hypothetical protein
VLRLHTDASGLVWYGDERGTRNSKQTPREFVENEGVLGSPLPAAPILLFGSHANAELITRLGDSMGVNVKRHVVLVAPIVTFKLHDPVTLLHQLLQPCSLVLASCHIMSAADLLVYAMAFELGIGTAPAELATRLAVRHPAWAAISFVRQGSVEAACRLLACILDPRWFRDPHCPSRTSRLRKYLGLTPDNARAFLSQRAQPGRHYDRAKCVFESWWTPIATDGAPANFLGREFMQYEANSWRSLLRASTRYLDLVVRLWLAATAEHPEALFDPKLFFPSRRDAEAFGRHVARRRVA